MSPNPSTGILCVLAKQPVSGQVKTRLAPYLSSDGAAELAGAMLQDSWALASSLPAVKPILVFAGDPASVQLDPSPTVWPQGDGDLGARLERCLQRALETAPWAIAIGTDSPGLPPEYIRHAIGALSGGSDAVLGPSEDGGYYLIGLRQCPDRLLARIPWSSPETFRATEARLQEHGSTVHRLEPWFDVDEPSDLQRLARELEEDPGRAPATARRLALLSTSS